MTINQGDIYWLKPDLDSDMGEAVAHPYVVVQDDLFNHSRVTTVIVCALTSRIERVSVPGNVLLDPDEANLPRQSVVEVAKVSSVDKARLGAYIGTLSPHRVVQILAGLAFVQRTFLRRDDAGTW